MEIHLWQADSSCDGHNNWRKRIGVEPTKDCQAASPGFEVRTSHRGANLFLCKQFNVHFRAPRKHSANHVLNVGHYYNAQSTLFDHKVLARV